MLKKGSKFENIFVFLFALGLLIVGIMSSFLKDYIIGFLFGIAGLNILAMQIEILILKKERDTFHVVSEGDKNEKEVKMKKYIKEQLYHSILAALLITVNIYFGIFVWMPSDLSPNIALGFITLPFIIVELIKLGRIKNERGIRKR